MDRQAREACPGLHGSPLYEFAIANLVLVPVCGIWRWRCRDACFASEEAYEDDASEEAPRGERESYERGGGGRQIRAGAARNQVLPGSDL